MTELTQLHKDLREQSSNIKDLTTEIVELNKTLVKVISDNDHRDSRIDDCKAQLVTVKKDIEEIHKQRTEDREEYKPVWDKSKQDQNNKAKYITNLTWFAIVALLIIITNSISSGLVKLPYSGKQETRQVK